MDQNFQGRFLSLSSELEQPGRSSYSPILEAVSEIMQKEELSLVLSTLTNRERKVIELRFGLKGEHPRTLEEVGQKFGVTRERVRQIQNIALRKMRRMIERREMQTT